MSPYGRARYIAWHLGVLLIGSVLIWAVLYLLRPSTAVANGVFASWLLLATVAPLMLALRSPMAAGGRRKKGTRPNS